MGAVGFITWPDRTWRLNEDDELRHCGDIKFINVENIQEEDVIRVAKPSAAEPRPTSLWDLLGAKIIRSKKFSVPGNPNIELLCRQSRKLSWGFSVVGCDLWAIKRLFNTVGRGARGVVCFDVKVYCVSQKREIRVPKCITPTIYGDGFATVWPDRTWLLDEEKKRRCGDIEFRGVENIREKYKLAVR